MRRRSLYLSLLSLPALACSPTLPAAPGIEGNLGGASFVLWPAPGDDDALDPAENPWLTGEALEPNASGGSPPFTSSGGQPAAAGGGAGAGGSSGQAPGDGGSTGTGGAVSVDLPVPAVLRFRAYVESTASFKGVLVEHVAGDPSGDCAVELYSNGSVELWRSLQLPAGLAQGERALLCVPDGAVAACTVGFGGSVYNGNDALVLRCDGVVQDIVGAVGVDPGKGWSGAGRDGQPASTADSGLWRCEAATQVPSAAFDIGQWMTWDWAADAAWQGPICPEADWGAAGAGGT